MKIDANWLSAWQTQAVFDRLTQGGFAAYGVGGCVRDTLLGHDVGDIDLCTDATPDQVCALFTGAEFKVVPTGIAHGTVTVIHHNQQIEITTFRQDKITDGRHAKIAFSTDIATDAARRDFTMNALYVDQTGQVHDPLGALPDLYARHVRFIGTPTKRITEDYLRILRFFRFIALYGDPALGIDADGLAACAAGLDGLAQVSKERITDELRKLLSAQNPALALGAMGQSGVLSAILSGATTTAIAPLITLEDGQMTDWHTRLAALRNDDYGNDLRLSKHDTKRIKLISKAARSTIDVAEVAYRHDAQIARNVALLRAALLGQTVAHDVMARIDLGKNAVFPLARSDLPNHLSGADIGMALRTAQTRWIQSDFTLTKAELLNGLS